MRSTSVFALIIMASAGVVTSLAPVPAMAAKDKKAEAPKAEYSKAFLAVAADLQKTSNAKDYAALQAAVTKATPVATSPDDMFLLNFYRFQLATGTNNTALQKEAVLGMLASGKAPTDTAGTLHGVAGQYAMQDGNMDAAIDHFGKAKAAGKLSPEAEYYFAEAYFAKAVNSAGGKVTPVSQPLFAQGVAHLQSAIDATKAAGQTVPAAWYARGAEIARAMGSADSTKFALEGVRGGGTPKAWAILLNGFQDSHRAMTRSENLDLMRLKSAAGALLAPQDYAEYVDAASKAGLVGEVKSVVDKGRSSGILTATNLADYYSQATGAIAADRKSLPASEAQAAKAATGKIAAATGDAYLSYDDYAKAAELYRLALTKGGVDADEINTRLGIALARSGDAAGAKAALSMVSGATRKQIAELWMTWLDNKPA